MATTRVLPINIVQEAQKPIKIVKLWLRRTAYIILVSILIYVLSVWIFHRFVDTKSVKNGNDSNIVAKTDVRQDSNTLNIVAPVGKWSEVIKAKNRYNWRWYQDDTNYKNVCSLIKVRINGNETVEEYYLPDGTRTGSCFSTTAYFVEFQSKEAWPVDMVVKFVK